MFLQISDFWNIADAVCINVVGENTRVIRENTTAVKENTRIVRKKH
jgi:hypothetical protein